MPYEWLTTTAAPEQSGAVLPPRRVLRLWPQHSRDRRLLAGFVGLTAALMAVPLLAVLGLAALWVLLAFAAAALAGLVLALRLSLRRGAVIEELTLAEGSLTLVRRQARHEPLYWQANPHWVQVHLHAEGGPVPGYLTLTGGGREVELGAFLTAGERVRLCGELRAALAASP